MKAFEKAINHITNNPSAAIRAIAKCLSNIRVGDSKLSEKDIEGFAQFIVKEIQNCRLKLSGTDKLVCFSPRTMRIALNIWFRSRAGYREFKDSSFQILPDES